MDTYKKINWENSSSTATPLSAENLNHMDDGIEAATTAITKIETDIAKKANTADVNSALSMKANTADVNAALAEKADKTSVDSALALKQNISNMFSSKQNLTDKELSYPSVKYLENYYYDMDDVDNKLALKADKEAVNAALSTKANKADVSTSLTLKANTTEVNAALAVKADKSTTLSGYGITDAIENGQGTVSSTNLADGSVTEEKLSEDVLSQINYASENVINLYGISTSSVLNDYTDTNKTYKFFIDAVNTSLGKELNLDDGYTNAMTRCILNTYEINGIKQQVLPYRSTAETMYVYTQFCSSKSKWMMANTNYSVLEVRHSTSGQVFEAEETLRFAISYYTA